MTTNIRRSTDSVIATGAALERKSFRANGHLVDSGIMKDILDTIIREGGRFDITRFDIGKTNEDVSYLEATFTAPNHTALERIGRHLSNIGCELDFDATVQTEIAPADGVAPDTFYTTTNNDTQVNIRGIFLPVNNIRMDGAIVISADDQSARCVKQRDLKKGDRVVVGLDGIKVTPEFIERDRSDFAFMTADVSSERAVKTVVERVAELMRDKSRKVVAVAGPVIVHTGGGPAFCRLVECGHIHGLLSGNALAVHDIESQLFGTSLGVNTRTGEAIEGGHSHHLRAINAVRRAGSIVNLVREGKLTAGVMNSLVTHQIPYALAGSIRDDGPLPETITDMNRAQEAYGEILEGAGICLMLSSMLHSIAVGNMLPARVITVCVDIHAPVVTKLRDRGSRQAIGVVTDVGLFLHLLADRLCG